MTGRKKVRRFPIRPKAVFKEVVTGEATPPNITPFPGTVHNKIVQFFSLRSEKTKTYPAILNFPVRA